MMQQQTQIELEKRHIALRRGLTLVEVMIAATIMATLMVGMWRLVTVYTTLREKGEDHADRVENVSVMMQQLEDDLKGLQDVGPNGFGQTPVHAEADSAMAGPGQNELGLAEMVASSETEAATIVASTGPIWSEHQNQTGHAPLDEDLSDAGPSVSSADQPCSPPTDRLAETQPEVGEFPTETSADIPYGWEPYRQESSQAEASAIPSAVETQPTCSLFGDETSLVINQVDSDASRSEMNSPETLSIENGPSVTSSDSLYSESPGGPQSVALSITRERPSQTSHRTIRYWVAGAMPFVMAGEGAAFQEVEDRLSLEEKGGAEEESIGLVREEVVSNGIPSESASEGLEKIRGGSGSVETAADLSMEWMLPVDDSNVGGPVMDGGPLAGPAGSDGSYESTLEDRSIAAALTEDNLSELPEISDEVSRSSFHLSKVEWVQFRYFDGHRWHSSWDSQVEGVLPVAIEMSLWLAGHASQGSEDGTPELEDIMADPVLSPRPAEWLEESATRGMASFSSQSDSFQADHRPSEFGDADLSGRSAESNPMGREPDLRQLVVLRLTPTSQGLSALEDPLNRAPMPQSDSGSLDREAPRPIPPRSALVPMLPSAQTPSAR